LHDYPLRLPVDRIMWSAHEYPMMDVGIMFWEKICHRGWPSAQWTVYATLYAVFVHVLRHYFSERSASLAGASMCGIALLLRVRHRIPCRRLLAPLGMVVLVIPILRFCGAALGQLYKLTFIEAIDSYERFAESRDTAWGHIVLNDIGPVLIGEFGANIKSNWWEWLMKYIQERDLHWSYWMFEGERIPIEAFTFGDNRGMGKTEVKIWDRLESYGLMEPDWNAPRPNYSWRQDDLRAITRRGYVPKIVPDTSSHGVSAKDGFLSHLHLTLAVQICTLFVGVFLLLLNGRRTKRTRAVYIA